MQLGQKGVRPPFDRHPRVSHLADDQILNASAHFPKVGECFPNSISDWPILSKHIFSCEVGKP